VLATTMGGCCEPLSGFMGGGQKGGGTGSQLTASLSGGCRSSQLVSLLPNNSGHSPKELYDFATGTVGTGAFGTVRKATKKGTKSVYAVKIIKKAAIPKIEAFRNEVGIHASLDHPNVVRLYETFEDRHQVYLIMEMCTGGEMFDEIIEQGSFTEADAATCMKQIMSALYHMHTLGMAHRDLKPENFLFKEKLSKAVPISQNSIKVIDFGIAGRFEHKPSEQDTDVPCLRTMAGTAYYVAPEVLTGKYSEKCDVWSSGVILYILLSGTPPFGGNDDQEIMKAVKRGVIDFNIEEFEKISNEAKETIKQMCKFEPKKRLSAGQALNSTWVQQKSVSKKAEPLSGAFMKKLKGFSSVNRFKKAALNIIAHRLEDSQIAKLRETFQSLDENGDGELTLAEIMKACNSAGLGSTDEMKSVFESLDVDGSGSIGYSEFLAGMIDQKNYLREELCWEAFRTFDQDGSGSIDIEELKMILKNQNMEQDQDVEALFAEADKNGDGKISFEEFCQMLRKDAK